jgi:hypothetical protein
MEAPPLLLRRGDLEVEVLPEVGGKIAQVRNRRTGISFLVPPQRPCRPLAPGENWVDHDTSGMDDCFPNIEQCPYPHEPWRGEPLPQMGEWVHGSWRVASLNAEAVRLEREGGLLPYRASKTVVLRSPGVLALEYTLENRGAAPFQYLWSAHPLIVAGDEFELILPERRLSFVTFPPDGRIYEWPSYGGLNLEHDWVPHGTDLKIFLTGLREGSCELRFPDRAVAFEFDPAAIPVLGVWFNNAAFPPGQARRFRCIAVEPCTSSSDVLDASDQHRDRVLEPASSHRWWLRLRFG